MKSRILVLLALACSLIATEANAWIVACNPDDLKRCHRACSKAGGTIVTDSKGREWCQIPYRIVDPNDPKAKILQDGGMNIKEGKDQLPSPPMK
jgi:hypothetical protein